MTTDIFSLPGAGKQTRWNSWATERGWRCLPSRAVVASNGARGTQNRGAVLHWVGGDLAFEVEENGFERLDDLGLADAPAGLSIWEGWYVFFPEREDSSVGEVEPRGGFRPLTAEELASVAAGRAPWSEQDWIDAGAPEPFAVRAVREAWEAARDREPESAIHPCDHFHGPSCMCRGACSCHDAAQQAGRARRPMDLSRELVGPIDQQKEEP